MSIGFEGSYMGAGEKISTHAIMECKICWSRYDPAEGDETRSILPGTPFVALPDDWKCPTCDAEKAQFLVFDDPGLETEEASVATVLPSRVDRLTAVFKEIHSARMRDVPYTNQSLHVQSIGFREWEGHILGVLVTPWMMSLVLMPATTEEWRGLVTGETSTYEFPSGSYDFIHAVRDELGGYKTCSLFSPMGDFSSQLQAVEVAEAVMQQIFVEENRAETDRREDIRAARMAELEPKEPAEPEESEKPNDDGVSRRALLGGGAG